MNKYQEAMDVIARYISDYKRGINRYSDREINNAMSNIVELVDKSVPTEPCMEADGYYNGELVYDIWVCPNCEKRYEIDDKYDYCPNCGQRLEYEDE